MRFPNWLHIEGDQTFRGDCPTEQMEQITLIRRIRDRWPQTFGAVVVHVKNEGKRTHGQYAFAKAEGLTAGAPDIFIPGNPSILIELKRRDHTKSKWQEGQLGYLEAAHKLGACVCVALGADAAMTWLEGLHK